MNDEREGALPGFDGLYADREPPPGLEDRVVASYVRARPRSRGTRRRGGPTVAARWLQLAAGLTLLLGGYGAGRLAAGGGDVASIGTSVSRGPGVSDTAPPGFLLLLWEDERFTRQAPPEGFAEEYAAWARAVAGRGVGISGYELGPDRAVVGRSPSGVDADVVGVPPEGTVSGYFVVQVDDLAAARRLAEGHPHVAHGGWIEVARMR